MTPPAIVAKALRSLDVLGMGGTAAVLRVIDGDACYAVKIPRHALTEAQHVRVWNLARRDGAPTRPPRISPSEVGPLWRHEAAIAKAMRAEGATLAPVERLVSFVGEGRKRWPALILECGERIEGNDRILPSEWARVERELFALELRKRIVNTDEVHLLRRVSDGSLMLADVASFQRVPKLPIAWTHSDGTLSMLHGQHDAAMPWFRYPVQHIGSILDRPQWREKATVARRELGITTPTLAALRLPLPKIGRRSRV